MIQPNHLGKHHSTFILRIVILLVGVILIAYTEVLERSDSILYDKIVTLEQYPQSPNITIVAIDEESLKILGRWPWSRGVHAELINRLIFIDNKAVALDFLLSELQDTDPNADHLLALAIAAHGNVILPVAPVSEADSRSLHLAQPLPFFRKHAVLGHTDIELDSDGVARRVFLYAGINAPTWPTLGLALADPISAKKANQSLNPDKESPEYWKQWVRSQEVLIPYTGQPGNFPTISYAQVLFDDEALTRLRNKTIIVGMTAAGMGTRFATPVSPINRQPMTGVEWHAHVFSMLQNHQTIHPIPKTMMAIVSVSWVAIILIVLSLLKRNLTIPLLLVLLAISLSFSGWILKLNHFWIPPSAALLGILSLYPLWNWHHINKFLRSFWITAAHSNTALQSIGDGVITTDAFDHVIYINQGAEKILRTQLSQIKGKFLQEVLDLHTKQNNLATSQSVKNSLPSLDSPGVIECTLKTVHGNERIVRMTRNQLYDDQKKLIGSVIAMTDITDTVELAQQIAHQESHDALTKLPNRTKLQAQFDRMIQAIHNTDKIITVLFVTLDNFKKINDAMGHHAGDKLLKMVSQRLFEIVCKEDVVARWGGR